MTDRLILELKNKFKNDSKNKEEKNKEEFHIDNKEITEILSDLQLTLKSLNYTKREINSILPNIIKESNYLTKKEKKLSFENLLKLAMNYLENDSGNLVR